MRHMRSRWRRRRDPRLRGLNNQRRSQPLIRLQLRQHARAAALRGDIREHHQIGQQHIHGGRRGSAIRTLHVHPLICQRLRE
jgi:hypothetical protein